MELSLKYHEHCKIFKKSAFFLFEKSLDIFGNIFLYEILMTLSKYFLNISHTYDHGINRGKNKKELHLRFQLVYITAN